MKKTYPAGPGEPARRVSERGESEGRCGGPRGREGGAGGVRRKERKGPGEGWGWEGGREEEEEERKRKGRGELSLWSSGPATQESLRSRKGRKCVPGLRDWGAPRHATPSSLLLCSPLTRAQAAPPTNGGPCSCLADSLAPKAQLPMPPQPCSSPSQLIPPLPSRELQAVRGAHPPPQPAALFFSFFSNLSTQCGGPAHEPEIKSRMPYRLSWPGTPSQQLSRASMRTRKSVLLGRQASVPDHTRFGRRSWGWPSVPSFPLGAQPLGTLVPTF